MYLIAVVTLAFATLMYLTRQLPSEKLLMLMVYLSYLLSLLMILLFVRQMST